MSIDEKVRAIAKKTEFADLSFVFENWYDADTTIERVALPAIIFVLPFSGSVEFKNGRTCDQENCAIAFVDKVPRNALGWDNSETYNRMKERGTAFLKAINASGLFEPLPDVVPYSVICERLSSIVTGVMFDVQLKEVRHC